MKIKFLPQNVDCEVKPGESVLNVARENGITIQSICKGVPSCAECRVSVVEGSGNVLPPMPEELDLIGTAHFVDQRRLACQMRCFGDVVVDLNEQVDKVGVSTKQPKGKVKKTTGDSMARMGNILEDETATVDVEITEEERLEAEKIMAEKEAREARQKAHPKKKSKNNRSRNNSNKARSQGQSQSQNAKGSSPSDKPKKKNNRNRNRNRNKKKASSSGGVPSKD